VSLLNLEIKPLLPEHLGAMVQLDLACFGGLWTLEGYQRELDSPNSELLGLFTPMVPSGLAGMGCFWEILEEAHITILAIAPSYQRQGFGGALLIALLTAACNRGLERATLEVRGSNSAAISLYEKFGFKKAGVRRRYYQDTGEDALILWRGDLQTPQFQQNLSQWHIQVSQRLNHSGWQLRPRL
jgi:ribosomal-protein-alanine N-acetyltransferase